MFCLAQERQRKEEINNVETDECVPHPQPQSPSLNCETHLDRERSFVWKYACGEGGKEGGYSLKHPLHIDHTLRLNAFVLNKIFGGEKI